MMRGQAYPQNMLVDLLWDVAERTDSTDQLLPPFFLLAGDIGRADDFRMGVNEK